MKNLLKLLEVKGKKISILLADGNWWIAIKPICEALDVDFEAQRKRINRHPLLSKLPSKQTVVAADNSEREMLCLPEKYIYGWLASINSDSEELIEYQEECYNVLFNHFHGRLTVLVERADIDEEIANLETALENTKEFQ